MKKDDRPTSQQIAHQTVAGLGILIFVIPFAILVIAGVLCTTGPTSVPDTRSVEEIQRDHDKWLKQVNANASANNSNANRTKRP